MPTPSIVIHLEELERSNMERRAQRAEAEGDQTRADYLRALNDVRKLHWRYIFKNTSPQDAELLTIAAGADSEEQKRSTSEQIARYIDEMLYLDAVHNVRAFFKKIDVDKIHPEISVPLATITINSHEIIGDEWSQFVARLLKALRETWNYPEDRCERIQEKLTKSFSYTDPIPLRSLNSEMRCAEDILNEAADRLRTSQRRKIIHLRRWT